MKKKLIVFLIQKLLSEDFILITADPTKKKQRKIEFQIISAGLDPKFTCKEIIKSL